MWWKFCHGVGRLWFMWLHKINSNVFNNKLFTLFIINEHTKVFCAFRQNTWLLCLGNITQNCDPLTCEPFYPGLNPIHGVKGLAALKCRMLKDKNQVCRIGMWITSKAIEAQSCRFCPGKQKHMSQIHLWTSYLYWKVGFLFTEIHFWPSTS